MPAIYNVTECKNNVFAIGKVAMYFYSFCQKNQEGHVFKVFIFNKEIFFLGGGGGHPLPLTIKLYIKNPK